jgi:hypothetical protein
VSRHFIFLTNTRLVSLESRRGRIEARREFAVSGTGVAEFERYLTHMPPQPVHMFTDLAEEDFRLDTIPHVGKGDREAILNRKLTQIFRNTPFRFALVQGREPEGRRDDRVLYTAVTNPEVLRPWTEVLDRLKVPLAGIHSAAVFSGVLLEELDLAFAHTLLVTLSPGGAMRQTYFRDGEIKFSRLTPMDLADGQSLGAMIAEETTRTWQYLDSLRHFSEDDRLEVCVLVHRNDRETVQPSLRDFAQIQYRILDIEQVSVKLGLKHPPLGSTAEELFIHLFLMRRIENHFRVLGDAALRHDSLHAHPAEPPRGGGARGEPRMGRVERLARVRHERRRPAPWRSSSRREPRVRGDHALAAVVRRRRLDDARRGRVLQRAIRGFPVMTDFAGAALRGAARASVGAPHADVVAGDRRSEGGAGDAPTPSTAAPPVRAVPKGADRGAPAPRRPRPPPLRCRAASYEVAHVEATLRVPANDFRGALDEVERLARRHIAHSGFRPRWSRAPSTSSSSTQLQGRLAEGEPA